MNLIALIAWLAEDHPAASLLTTVPTAGAPEIISTNRAFEQLSGYRREDVLGRSPRLLQGPRTDARAARLLASSARAGRPARAVLLNYRRDGSEYLCEVTVQPVRVADDPGAYMLGLAREVRRRRGRPAGEGLRFLPVTQALGLAAFGHFLPAPPCQLAVSAATTSRGSTVRADSVARTTA